MKGYLLHSGFKIGDFTLGPGGNFSDQQKRKKEKKFRTSMSKISKSPSFSANLIFYHSVSSVGQRCSRRENMGIYRIRVQ